MNEYLKEVLKYYKKCDAALRKKYFGWDGDPENPSTWSDDLCEQLEYDCYIEYLEGGYDFGAGFMDIEDFEAEIKGDTTPEQLQLAAARFEKFESERAARVAAEKAAKEAAYAAKLAAKKAAKEKAAEEAALAAAKAKALEAELLANFGFGKIM